MEELCDDIIQYSPDNFQFIIHLQRESCLYHMATSFMMDKDQSHVTERILDLTLEIIYLLTGEDYKVVKAMSGEALTSKRCHHRTSSITVPLPHCPPTERTNAKKILDITQKIIELLTREVPVKRQDVTVYVERYFEGHKDLYKDVMMAGQPALASADGSKNPPEKCPRPLYSHWDSTQEDVAIPHHHEVGVTITHHHEVGVTIPHSLQDEELRGIKVEIKEEEETLVSGDQPSMEEGKMSMESKQEESSLYMDTHGRYVWNTVRKIVSPAVYYGEDNDITPCPPGLDPTTHILYHRPSPRERPMDPSKPDEPSVESPFATSDTHLNFPSTETMIDSSDSQAADNQAEPPYVCSNCGKYLATKASLMVHHRIHTGERPFSCTECGKSFTQQSGLNRHRVIHTGERPYPCPECGKSFTRKRTLMGHLKIHTYNGPFLC